MFTISLHNLVFFSFHGVHEEERILGNKYEVNVTLSFNTDEQITTLQQTINYASVYEIIKQRMAIPAKLMETLAQDLAQKIVEFDNRITSISVSIEKKNPPIPNIEGSVSVNYKKES
jgi:7,8-dihydroneopterin aldolase/epimerase/oxygenase